MGCYLCGAGLELREVGEAVGGEFFGAGQFRFELGQGSFKGAC